MSQEDKDRLLKILVENDMTADRAVGYIPFNNITIYKVLYFRAVIPRTHIVQSVTVAVDIYVYKGRILGCKGRIILQCIVGSAGIIYMTIRTGCVFAGGVPPLSLNTGVTNERCKDHSEKTFFQSIGYLA